MNTLLRPDPMTPVPYRITHRHQDTPEVFTLELLPASGGEPLTCRPGQFTMLYAFGVGEVPISVSGDPDQPRLVHTVRDVGAVTRRLGSLGVGASIGVRGPYGRPWPLEAARGRDLLVVAGGLGMAPVRPILYQVMARRERFARVTLVYGARQPGELLYGEELKGWQRDGRLEVLITVDRPDDHWSGPVGLVTALLPRVALDPASGVAMICGPEAMMEATAWALLKGGLAGERIFLSLERNMKCGIGTCGHCQLGPYFICKDGPVFSFSELMPFLGLREL